jgi:hypothetical protein
MLLNSPSGSPFVFFRFSKSERLMLLTPAGLMMRTANFARPNKGMPFFLA